MKRPLYHRPTSADRQDRWSWQLGRVLGIPMRVHASFALLIAWVAFSTWRSAHSAPAVLFGIGLALAVFACVLLHELGHALAARRFGIETRRITLLPIGGVAELERAPKEPRAELWIALAGPAVNFMLASALALFGFTTGLLSGGGLAAIALQTLMWANLMLSAFNLLPAFPMDGGRVYRAWAQARHGRVEGTRRATKLSRWLAAGLGAWGLYSGNPVLALVALFVWFAASRELQAVRQVAAFEATQRSSAPAWAHAPSNQDPHLVRDPSGARVIIVRRR